MATSPNKGVVLLETGQKEKESTVNAMIAVWDAEKVFAGYLAADPTNPSAYPVGSIYYNTSSRGWFRLASKGPDVWTGFGVKYFGDQASAPASGEFEIGSTYYDTTAGALKVLRSKSPDVWG